MNLSPTSFIFIYIFLGVAAIILVMGIFFIRSGADSKEEKVEPIDNPQDLLRLKSELAQVTKQSLFKAETPLVAPNPLIKEIEDYKIKVTALEDEKTTLRLTMEDLQLRNQERINAFEKEIAQLKQTLAENSTKLDEIAQLKAKQEQTQTDASQIETLKNENQTLSEQLQASRANLQEIQQGLKTASDNEQKLESAHATIDALESELRKIRQSRRDLDNEQFSEAQKVIEQLKSERDRALKDKEGLELSHTKIKEFNEHLLEKEKILRYELTKARAQALGLEKICAELKRQQQETSTLIKS